MVVGKIVTISVGLMVVLAGKPVRVLAIAQKVGPEKVCLNINFSIFDNRAKDYNLSGELNGITIRSKTKLYAVVMEIINLSESKIVKALSKGSNN